MSLNVYIEELVLCHPDTKAFSTQKPYIVVKTVPFYENREQLCSITLINFQDQLQYNAMNCTKTLKC